MTSMQIFSMVGMLVVFFGSTYMAYRQGFKVGIKEGFSIGGVKGLQLGMALSGGDPVAIVEALKKHEEDIERRGKLGVIPGGKE